MFTPGDSGSSLGHSFWRLWWANSHRDMLSSEYFCFPNAPYILNLRHVTVNTVYCMTQWVQMPASSVTKPPADYKANYKETVTLSVSLVIGVGRYFLGACEMARLWL